LHRHGVLKVLIKSKAMESGDTLKENVSEYIETKVDLIKLKAIDKGASVLSGIVVGAATALLALFILVFLSFAAAFAIAELTGKNSLGFLAIAGFYIIVAVLLFILKEKIVTMPIVNALLNKFYYRK